MILKVLDQSESINGSYSIATALPLVLSTTTKPSIPQFSHYHSYKQQKMQKHQKYQKHRKRQKHKHSYRHSYSHSNSDFSSNVNIAGSPSLSKSINNSDSYDIEFSDHSLNYSYDDNYDKEDNDEEKEESYIVSIQKQYKRDKRYDDLKQRKYSDVYSAFSLKRARYDSLASQHKISISDQRILQKGEWDLINALKTQNKNIIIDAIQSAKIEVLSNFLPFICLMLSNVVSNIYNIHAIKHDIIMILVDIIKSNIDLQQLLSFIISSYPESKLHELFHNNKTINAVRFWNKIINFVNVYQGYNFKIEKHNDKFRKYQNKIVDPIIVDQKTIKLIAVKKILNSNAKPLLLDIYVNDDAKMNSNEKNVGKYQFKTYSYNKLCQNGIFSSSIILKKGDDLRKDHAIMLVFKFMNQIFKTANIHYNGIIVNILTYKVIPISNKCGIIELIPDCIGLKDITTIKQELVTDGVDSDDNLMMNNLISSSAAAYISCLIMGIRDRHYDNQMIRKIDYKLFHIDHQFIFGEKASIDASELGITKSLANIMGNKYKIFVELAIETHSILRLYHEELIDFTTMAFSYLYLSGHLKENCGRS